MTETVDQRHERALATVKGLLGEEFSDQLRNAVSSTEFGAGIARLAVDSCFADTWGRDELANRDRSFVMIGILIALRQPKELKNHIKIGISNGLTAREIEAALVQATPYVGVPAISGALTSTVEALRECGILAGALTSEEKGLL